MSFMGKLHIQGKEWEYKIAKLISCSWKLVVIPPKDVGKKFTVPLNEVGYSRKPSNIKRFIETKFEYPLTPLITPYEVGNDILHKLCYEMVELEKEFAIDYPEVSLVLKKNRLMYGSLVNTLMEEDLAPTPKTHGKIKEGLQGIIDKARKKYEDNHRRKQEHQRLRDSQ